MPFKLSLKCSWLTWYSSRLEWRGSRSRKLETCSGLNKTDFLSGYVWHCWTGLMFLILRIYFSRIFRTLSMWVVVTEMAGMRAEQVKSSGLHSLMSRTSKGGAISHILGLLYRLIATWYIFLTAGSNIITTSEIGKIVRKKYFLRKILSCHLTEYYRASKTMRRLVLFLYMIL